MWGRTHSANSRTTRAPASTSRSRRRAEEAIGSSIGKRYVAAPEAHMPRAHARTLAVLVSLGVLTTIARAEEALPPRWDDLTAAQWPQALERSGRTCILPFGVLEKHGMH